MAWIDGEWMTEADFEETITGICTACGEECKVRSYDDSFDYSYGSINAVHKLSHEGSDCCDAEVVEGAVNEIRTAVHVARKEHNNGRIKPGDTYRLRVFRHWKKDGPNWITTSKSLLKRKGQ
jgi:hypothetical protein